ncbi:MAG: amidohydrolase family protein [Pseudomonadota bacterium]
MRIDAHQHFWEMSRGDYDWLTPDLAPIFRDFGAEDLWPHLQARGIDGTVLVQAAPTLAETEYMLGLAEKHAFVLGVVGWADFESPNAPDTIKALAARPKLVGLRPMIQDIDDVDWMLRPSLGPAFAAMVAHDLVFDALTLPRHLPNLRRLIDRYPGLRAVIDHGSKPEIRHGAFETWAADMAAIAAETDAVVKMSGLVTEAAKPWQVDDMRPYTDHLLEHFGPARILWGSDWPVCTLAATYEAWCQATDSLLGGVADPDLSAILGRNALSIYKLARP